MKTASECYEELKTTLARAKRAFRAVVVHLNDHPTPGLLSDTDRVAIGKLITFWRGDPLRHQVDDFYDIKPLHVLNRSSYPDPEIERLWLAYIEPVMAARCTMIHLANLIAAPRIQ